MLEQLIQELRELTAAIKLLANTGPSAEVQHIPEPKKAEPKAKAAPKKAEAPKEEPKVEEVAAPVPAAPESQPAKISIEKIRDLAAKYYKHLTDNGNDAATANTKVRTILGGKKIADLPAPEYVEVAERLEDAMSKTQVVVVGEDDGF